MEERLYASPEEIRRRTPKKKNIELGSALYGISTALIVYLAKRTLLRLEDYEVSIKIFKDYSEKVNAGLKNKREYREGIFKFNRKAVEGDKAYEELSLISKEPTINFGEIIRDLEKMLGKLESKTLDSGEAEFASQLLDAWGEILRKEQDPRLFHSNHVL